MTSTSSTGAQGGSTGTGATPVVGATNTCGAAPLLAGGSEIGTLNNKTSIKAGACGLGGPDAFVEIDVPVRADVTVEVRAQGFVARLGILGNGCEASWDEHVLLCSDGAPRTIPNVAAGTRLIASVGVDPEDAAAMAGDSMPFELIVTTLRIRGPGELCLPVERGRCEAGTQCTTLDPKDEFEPARCHPISADTCQTAQDIALTLAPQVLRIDAVAYSDAHAHSCGPLGTPERVYRLKVPDDLPDDLPDEPTQLWVTAEAAASVAIRAGTCLPEAERLCAQGPQPTAVGVPVAAGEILYLFIELPLMPPEGEEAPLPDPVPGPLPGPLPVLLQLSEQPPT